MRLAILAALAAGALLAWRRRSERAMDARADEMDAVQADPWPASVRDNVVPALDPDPPYLEAMALVNMRRAYGGNPIANT